jgi:hypothetical protein
MLTGKGLDQESVPASLVARLSEGLALGRGIGKPEVEFQWAKDRA